MNKSRKIPSYISYFLACQELFFFISYITFIYTKQMSEVNPVFFAVQCNSLFLEVNTLILLLILVIILNG